MNILTCAIDGCARKILARGWCATHYARWRKYGDVNFTMIPHREVKGTCIADGCAREDAGVHGYCNLHRQRVKKYGDPTVNKKATGRKLCSVDGCHDQVEGLGLCPKHRVRLRRHGDTQVVNPIPTLESSPHWKGENASYGAIHYRLRKYKGKASSHDCTDCGSQAKEWSYLGGDPNELFGPSGRGVDMAYSQNMDYYTPRCVPCHRHNDLCKQP